MLIQLQWCCIECKIARITNLQSKDQLSETPSLVSSLNVAAIATNNFPIKDQHLRQAEHKQFNRVIF